MIVGKKTYLRVPLSYALILMFLVLNVLFIGGIITYNYIHNGKIAYSYKSQSITSTAYKLSEQIDDLFKPVYLLTERAQRLAWSPVGDPFPIESRIEVAQIMSANPQISSVYFAADGNDFIQIFSVPHARLFERGLPKPPAGARFAIRHLQGKSDTRRREIWSYFDDQARLMGDMIERENLYDPNTRPWHKAAMLTDQTVISEPYPYLSVKSVGITASRRIPGWRGGVFGIDLTLESLSQALDGLSLLDRTTALIFTESGALLAKNRLSDGSADVSDQHDAVAHIAELNDPVAKALYATLHNPGGKHHSGGAQASALANGLPAEPEPETKEHRGEFTIDRLEYVAQIMPLSPDFAVPTFIGFAVPKRVLLNDVEQMLENSVFVSIIFLAASIFITSCIARSLTVPISQLANDTQRIQRFELEDSASVTSAFSELHDLGHSIGAMKKSLKCFARYIPEIIVKKLVQDGSEPVLGGDNREVTIMFTDVANFSGFSELMPPRDLMRKLSSYLDCLSREIRAENGIVDKFIGDSVMGVWNAFDDEEDHALRGCMAALKCCEANDKLNAMWRSFGWPEMHSRIGLHTGEAIVGNIGSSERMEHTTIGATVNVAARMEGLNKTYKTRVLVSEPVYARARDKFLMRPVDIVVPKGSAHSIEVYELLGTLEDYGSITATDEDKRRCALWQAIYDRLQDRKWNEAVIRLKAYLDEFPNDQIALHHMAQIQNTGAQL